MRIVEDDDPAAPKVNGWRCPYCQKKWDKDWERDRIASE
jgi:hypothetical protein